MQGEGGGEGGGAQEAFALRLRLRLARQYFTYGGRLASHRVLEEAAVHVGLQRGAVRSFLQSDQLRDEVAPLQPLL